MKIKELRKAHDDIRETLLHGKYVTSDRISFCEVEAREGGSTKDIEAAERTMDDLQTRNNEIDDMLGRLDALFDQMIGYIIRVNEEDSDDNNT